jgi:tripartite-type tricarboxylate transporter receptor subunit TctC
MVTKSVVSTCASLLLAAGLVVRAPSPAFAQSAEQFYHGKTVTLVVGYAAGAGYDFFGRLTARHLGRHIPGQPTVVVQNMPGAGSILAANYVYNAAPKDGSVLGLVTQTVALEEVLGTQGVRFKADQFNWIGRVTSNVDILLAWHNSKVKRIEDALKIEVPLAAPGSGLFLPTIINHVVGTKFRMITGYGGAGDTMLAMERGEVDAVSTSWTAIKATKQDWLDNKMVNVLVQYGMERLPQLPDVPTMIELGKTPEQKQVLTLYASGSVIGRSIFTSPGVPAERVQALRDAFDAMIKDPQLLADVEQSKAEFDPMSGAELQKIIAQAGNIPPAVRDLAIAARGD